MSTITPLLSAEQIASRVQTLAAEIAAALEPQAQAQGLVVIGPLKGAVIFMADLVRALHPHLDHVEMDFLGLSSYGAGTTSSGTVTLDSEPRHPVAGRHVLLVDDIADTGRTLAFAQGWLHAQGVASLRTVTLLNKPSRRQVEISLEHVGFEIPNLFVVGYGTDHAERYRELPFVGVEDT
ncbi:MAG: hypoxanthine phosphoribosyltransferase [Oligoflexia bacterium]|nr:hypoxanthine phosphoribosyltransferase [Oligoflexia bacterium]